MLYNYIFLIIENNIWIKKIINLRKIRLIVQFNKKWILISNIVKNKLFNKNYKNEFVDK